MKIASATMQMEAQHSQQQSQEVSSSLRSWVVRSAPAAAAPLVQISDSGLALQSSEANAANAANETSALQDGFDAADNDPMLRLIRSLIELLTGKEIKVLKTHAPQHATAPSSALRIGVAQPPSAPVAAAGFEYTHHEAYSESEQTRFAASGVINTSDGRQIDFSVALSMTRSFSMQTDTSLTFGAARQTQDPLVINFDGTAAQLTSQRYAFDLDADGNSESINFVADGSGFLALDRNADGRIDDGNELFGTQSGDGFSDLAGFDSDANGWIDENDAIYGQLLIWSKDASGNDQLSTLQQSGVGAIGLMHTATPFALKDTDNALQGQVRSSGIFLHEDGQVGTVQQVDLTV